MQRPSRRRGGAHHQNRFRQPPCWPNEGGAELSFGDRKGLKAAIRLGMPKRSWRAIADRRRRLYQILEHGTIGDRTGAAVARLIIGLIVVNLIAVALESVPEFELRYESLFTA